MASDPHAHNSCNKSSTISSLMAKQCQGKNDRDCCNSLVSCPTRFATSPTAAGLQYEVVPSSYTPSPRDGTYFMGGYLISLFKTTQGSGFGMSDAIGIETPRNVSSNSTTRQTYVRNLAQAVTSFHRTNYNPVSSGVSST